MLRMLPDLQLHYGASVRGMECSWNEIQRHCDFPSCSLLQVKPQNCTLLIHRLAQHQAHKGLQLILLYISKFSKDKEPACSAFHL